ncbi:MAG: long-chain fatty acid--CoA ligase, partial [Desulfobacca sp.]|nr:long-chain fatty acid--CoA ligase [Desulfobacca sp.]
MEKPWTKTWPAIYPRSLKYYEGSIVDFMEASARRFPDRAALIFMEKSMSYGALLDQTLRLATALTGLGVKKGDRVALFMPNCPQFVVAYYAVLKIGAILTMCSPLNSEEELKYQLIDSGAETIFTLKLNLLMDKLMKVKAQTGLKRIIISGLDEVLPLVKKQAFLLFKKKNIAPIQKNPDAGVYFFKDLLAQYPPDPPQVTINGQEDIAVLAYTGGTTGLPKGAMITHYNTIVNVSQVMNWLAPALGYPILENPTPESFNGQGRHMMIVN